MPPLAASNNPIPPSASVNAPHSCPNKTDSIRLSGIAAQFTVINGLSLLVLFRQMSFATSSFPTPVSPVIKTLAFVGATFEINLLIFLNAELVPVRFEIKFSGKIKPSLFNA